MKLLKTLMAVGLASLLAACGQQTETNVDKNELQIMTSFYPMQVFTEEVVGDVANVDVMIASDQDSHDYEPSASDIAKLEQADVFVYNSNEMESWVPTTIESLDTEDLTIIESAGDIDLLSGEVEELGGHEGETSEEHAAHAEEVAHEGHDHAEHEGHSHEFDPHTWLDPVLAQQQVQTIADALKEEDPANGETYQANADAFITELNTLDQEFKTAFEGAENRTFLTQHAAFAYLADRYDLHQVAVTGVTSSEEPSPQRLAELTDYVEATDAEIMYMQAGTSTNISETIANETGIELSTLNSLETVSEDVAAGGEGYLMMMRDNLENLKLAIK